MAIDIDRFPTDRIAQRMMRRVSPIYGRSYLAKWLYQVMGAEMSDAWHCAEEVRAQAFVDTTTWGISYWEHRYTIEPDDTLSIEERRARIHAKRSRKYPMNPAVMEKIVGDVCGRDTAVVEHVAAYTFGIVISAGESAVDYAKVIAAVNKAKPSHLSYRIVFETALGIAINAERQAYHYHVPFTDTLYAGTHPRRAMEGAVGTATVRMQPAAAGGRYRSDAAGTRPYRYVMARLRGPEIEICGDSQDYMHRVSLTGQYDAGELPQRGEKAALRQEDIAVNAVSTSYTRRNDAAGTQPYRHNLARLQGTSVDVDGESASYTHRTAVVGQHDVGEYPQQSFRGTGFAEAVEIAASATAHNKTQRPAGSAPYRQQAARLRDAGIQQQAEAEAYSATVTAAGTHDADAVPPKGGLSQDIETKTFGFNAKRCGTRRM